MIHEQRVTKQLTPKQQAIWQMLRRGHARTVDELFSAAYAGRDIASSRVRQQYIGPIISGINAVLALEDYKIMPGIKRRTYRLRSLI